MSILNHRFVCATSTHGPATDDQTDRHSGKA